VSASTIEPLYEAPGGDPNAERILLVSDQFPPAQSAGSLRWQKLSRFAADRGWIFDVITRDPALLTVRDDSRLSDLPPGTRVFAFRPEELAMDKVERWASRAVRGIRATRMVEKPPAPVRGADALRGKRVVQGTSLGTDSIRWNPLSPRFWMRSYWAWLDHRRQLLWARAVERVGIRVLDPRRHRAVISSGPWHLCNHEAARRLARRGRVPFIMDLRDPWSLPRRIAETIASPVWFALARHYESRAVRDASLVVVNAEPVERAMSQRYPGAAERIMTITNGFDEEDVPASQHARRYTIAYAGGIYLDRDPRPLFQAASRVIAEQHLSPDDLGIEFIGNVDDYGGVPIARMAVEEGIADYVRTGPSRPRRDALEFLSRATMLLSLPQDSPWAIPSKIFEYMQFDAWLLVLAESDAPAALLLRGTSADIASPLRVDAIADVLRLRLSQYRAGERPVRLSREMRFSRRHQAERLMDAIAARVSSSRPARLYRDVPRSFPRVTTPTVTS
jgi:hypothetical protein